MRGLCKPLAGSKPYSKDVIIRAIDEILSSDVPGAKLTEQERFVFEREKSKFTTLNEGFDVHRGGYYVERIAPRSDIRFSLDASVSWTSIFSESLAAKNGDFEWGTDNWGALSLKGDMGENFSYSFIGSGGLFRAPRPVNGEYNTYYAAFSDHDSFYNQKITTFGQPTAFFPYTYKKGWEASFVSADNLSSSAYGYGWPSGAGLGYRILGEMSGSMLDGYITYRFGRINREWGAMSNGQSLSLNAAAMPFMALEAIFTPFDWLSLSALTGVLEYYNTHGRDVALTNQNAFSQALLEVNYKSYFHFDIGSSAVWPKRFELGYLYPANSNFFYQSTVGDFDNMALAVNLRGQIPGIGNAWFSFFADEFDISTKSSFFKLDRNMYAFQLGMNFHLPVLSFSTLTFSLTKIEPYCYTHMRVFAPWYGDSDGNSLKMEEAYTNNGEGLGYYLPPNSAELLVKFESLTGINTKLRAQFQLVIHGADFGTNAVDGSSLLSELDPDDRNSKDELKKFFLQDGAYQWQTVLKVGAEHSLAKYDLPIKIFGEIGIVHTFFTDIAGTANSGSKSSFAIVDNSEYPRSTQIIGTIGFRVYM
jgi:hypothetical protein